ncbi:ATP-binding protein [Bradyrhizobium sp. 48]|uniref:ATP-binding protein n=1 Tax=Bradyrhizobium sp. 48 TaxID=2782676 RepID=UPI001FF9B3AD|nr:ATP-binding protein [Bradyrhizobium sp. 48]MCK1441475.1 ATP-binding protein [Bradyrhizobium sp. 48]
MRSDPTLIGTVQDVAGTAVSVALVRESATGLSFYKGESYRIGQVGSFVRIPLGYTSLFGIVSQVGAGAAPKAEGDARPWGNQWLSVQLVGERGRNGQFERGVSQHPTINDAVHIVTEDDLREIYGPGDPVDFVSVGRLASAESIPALVNINKLVTRHCAVVGTTGAGKSTTVAGLLAALSQPERYPSSRIVILDIHGEYAKALADRATVFRITPDTEKDEKALVVPFWALSFEELIKLSFGKLDDRQAAVVADKVVELKAESLSKQPREGIVAERLTADTPVPFCIHKLWFEFHQREHRTVIPKPGAAADEIEAAYVLGTDGKPVQPGDAMSVTPPLYRTVKTSGPPAERVNWGPDALNIRQQLAVLASKLRDPQFAFLFNPTEWTPQLDGTVKQDLDAVLKDWIGTSAPITILDLSGTPSTVLNDLVGALLRMLYDALFWARNLPEGGRERPLMIVLEEAHAYLGKEHVGPAASAVRRIAKEGRKYGVGVMIVSQRPSEIDPTILSQCGTIFAMRLANDVDRGQVAGSASDNLKGLFDMLPILRTGEAIIVGEAVSLPIRTLIDPPDKGRRPDSSDPRVVVRGDPNNDGYEGEGGWAVDRHDEDYAIVMRQWRKQSPRYEHKKGSSKSASPGKKKS